jgi:hypothetical protein
MAINSNQSPNAFASDDDFFASLSKPASPVTPQAIQSDEDFFNSLSVPKQSTSQGGFTSSLKSVGGALLAGAGQAAKDVGITSLGDAAVQQGRAIQDANRPAVQSFSDIAEHPGKWISESAGQMGGQAGLAIAGGLAGRAAGAGLGALTGPFAPVAIPALSTAGAYIGGNLPMLAQEYGSARQEQEQLGVDDKGRALTGALATTAIENLGGLKPGGMANLVADGVNTLAGKTFKEGAKIVGKQMLRSGVEEGLEEIPQEFTGAYAGGQDDLLTAENMQQGLFGAVSAFPGGALFGAGKALGPLARATQQAPVTPQEAVSEAQNANPNGDAEEIIRKAREAYNAADVNLEGAATDGSPTQVRTGAPTGGADDAGDNQQAPAASKEQALKDQIIHQRQQKEAQSAQSQTVNQTDVTQPGQEQGDRLLPESTIQQGGVDAKVQADTGPNESADTLQFRYQLDPDTTANGIPETRPPLADDLTQKTDAELEVLRQNTFNVRNSESLKRRAEIVAEQKRRKTQLPQEDITNERQDANAETWQEAEQERLLATHALPEYDNAQVVRDDTFGWVDVNDPAVTYPAESTAVELQQKEASNEQENRGTDATTDRLAPAAMPRPDADAVNPNASRDAGTGTELRGRASGRVGIDADGILPTPDAAAKDDLSGAAANVSKLKNEIQPLSTVSDQAKSGTVEALPKEGDDSPLSMAENKNKQKPSATSDTAIDQLSRVQSVDNQKAEQSASLRGNKTSYPWEMTQHEYAQFLDQGKDTRPIRERSKSNPLGMYGEAAIEADRLGLKATLLRGHKTRVDEAVDAGQSIPDKVLNEYPDLRAKQNWNNLNEEDAKKITASIGSTIGTTFGVDGYKRKWDRLSKENKDKLTEYFKPNESTQNPNTTTATQPPAQDANTLAPGAIANPTGAQAEPVGASVQGKDIPVLTEEEYLAQQGYGRGAIGEAGLHRSSNNISRKVWQKKVDAQFDKDAEVVKKRAELRQEYQDKVVAGEIRSPSRFEELIKKANGHPDNEAVQAARRLLEKKGIDWENPQSAPISKQEALKNKIAQKRKSGVSVSNSAKNDTQALLSISGDTQASHTPVTWEQSNKSRWKGDDGSTILKYRMNDKYYFLHYEKGQPLDGGDYKTFNTLSEAKQYSNAPKQNSQQSQSPETPSPQEESRAQPQQSLKRKLIEQRFTADELADLRQKAGEVRDINRYASGRYGADKVKGVDLREYFAQPGEHESAPINEPENIKQPIDIINEKVGKAKPKSDAHKLKLKYEKFFADGIKEGAQAKILGIEQSPEVMAQRYSSSMSATERSNFIAGFNKASDYITDLREGKNLTLSAIVKGDVIPVDFEMDYNGRQTFAKEKPKSQSLTQTPETPEVKPKADTAAQKEPSSSVTESAKRGEGRAAPIISQDDISYDAAYRAYSGISFDPEKRAKSTQEEYVNYMQSVYDDVIKIAKTDEQRATIDEAFENYRKGYIQKQLAHLQAKSRTLSPMITGPANFPTRRNEKANNAEHKRLEEFLEWDKKALARLKEIARGTRSQEEIKGEQFEIIRRDLASSLSTIKGIDNGTVRGSSRSLFVNNLANRIKTLARNGKTDLVNKALDYIADYQKDLAKPLISSKHSIWDLRGQVAEQPVQAENPTGTETIKEYQGASVVNNRDAERVQILFDEKPSEQVRNALKKAAFKWSPSNNAWQRQNTPNGIAAAKRVLDGLYADNAKFSQSQPTTGSTVAELTAKLDATDKKLLQAGKLEVAQKASDVPDSAVSIDANGIEGFYLKGKVYVVADNVTPSTLRSVLAHEYLHASLAENQALRDRILGAQSELRDIFAQVEAGKYTGRYKPLYDEALRRVNRAQTNEADRFEEFLAYVVTQWNKAPQSLPERLAKAIQNLVAAIRAAIFKYSGKIDKIGPAELSSLAKSAMNYSENPNSSTATTKASTKTINELRSNLSSWTDKRIASLMREFSYTTEDGKTKAYATWMSPTQFIESTTPASEIPALEKENKPLDNERLAADGPIRLYVTPESEEGVYQITGHEGRHRMMALRDAGVDRVPVVLVMNKAVSNAQSIDEPYFRKQKYDDSVAKNSFDTNSMTPISWSYHNQLKEDFGRDNAAIRFSQSPDIRYSIADDAFADVPVQDNETWATQAKQQFDKATDAVFKQRFAFLSVKQMAEVAKRYAPGLKDFARLLSKRETLAGDIMRQGDRLITEKWNTLDKKTRGYLAYVINQSTVHDVDASKTWYGVKQVSAQGERKAGFNAWTQAKIPESQHAKLVELAQRHNAIQVFKNSVTFATEQEAAKFAPILSHFAGDTERKAAHQDLKRKLAVLPPKAREVYQETNQQHTDLFNARLNALFQNIDDAILDADKRKLLKNAIRLKFETDKLDWYYAPLSRFGRYWVYADKGGEREFSTYETAKGRDERKAQLEKDGYKILGDGTSLDKNLSRQMDGTSDKFVQDVQNLLGQSLMPEQAQELQEQVYQMYLETLPDVSMRKHSIHRQGTPGYEKDAQRTFANSIHHGAKQLATMQISPKMRDVLELHKDALDVASSPYKRDKLLAENEAASWLQQNWIPQWQPNIEGAPALAEAIHSRYPSLSAEDGKEAMQRIIDKNNAIMSAAEKIGTDDKTKLADILNELQMSYNAMQEGNSSAMDRIAIAMNQANFLGFMGFNLSSMFVNTLQTPIVAVPLAGGKYGYDNASAQFTKAFSEFMTAIRKKQLDEDGNISIAPSLSGDERLAMDEFKKFDISRTQAFDLIGVGEQGENHGGFLHHLSKKAGWMFHHSERMNREVTLLAAYRLARKAGQTHEQALESARELNDNAHLDYSSENAARIFRGPIARVSLQFKKYTQGMYYVWAKTALDAAKKLNRGDFKSDAGYQQALAEKRQALRSLAGMFVMQGAFAGAMGMPMMGAALAAVNLLGSALDGDDEPWDLERDIRIGLHNLVGPALAETISKGLFNTITPIDLSSRLDLSDIFFRPLQRDLEGKDAADQYLIALLGPTGGTVGRIANASKLMGDGQYMRAAEQFVPNALGSLIKAYRFGTEDAKSMQGVTLKDMSAAEVAFQTLGFSSADLNRKYDERNYILGQQNYIQDARLKLLHKAADAKQAGEPLPLKEISDWNKDYPTKKITMKHIRASIRTAKRREKERGDRGFNLDKKLRYLEDEFALG